MDIVLFGIQGSGKGTQGQHLVEKFKLQLFETGGELRRLSQEDSELGGKVKSIIEAGHLVPTEVVMEIIENFMAHLPAGTNVLFDGIPRKPDQAEAFNNLMSRLGRNFLGVIIDISKEEALNRLLSRRICPLCKTVYPKDYTANTCAKDNSELITRTDDNPESIKNRLDAFFNETLPVIEDYKKQGKMITVNGEQSIAKVTEDLFNQLSSKL